MSPPADTYEAEGAAPLSVQSHEHGADHCCSVCVSDGVVSALFACAAFVQSYAAVDRYAALLSRAEDGAPCLARPNMSLRDWFAGQAMALYRSTSGVSPSDRSDWCYEWADAMLEQREKGAPFGASDHRVACRALFILADELRAMAWERLR